MKTLAPVKLHKLIGYSAAWTDELWANALAYLLDNTSTVDAVLMCECLPGKVLFSHLHKIDYLREFQPYPPTLILGAFDWMRLMKATQADQNAKNQDYVSHQR